MTTRHSHVIQPNARRLIQSLLLFVAMMMLSGCDVSYDILVVNYSCREVIVKTGLWEWHADPCMVSYQGMRQVPHTPGIRYVGYSIFSTEGDLIATGRAELMGILGKQGNWRFPWLVIEYSPISERCDASSMSDLYYVKIVNTSHVTITAELGDLGPLEVEPLGSIRVGPLQGSYEDFLQPEIVHDDDTSGTDIGLLELDIEPHRIGKSPELIFAYGEVRWSGW